MKYIGLKLRLIFVLISLSFSAQVLLSADGEKTPEEKAREKLIKELEVCADVNSKSFGVLLEKPDDLLPTAANPNLGSGISQFSESFDANTCSDVTEDNVFNSLLGNEFGEFGTVPESFVSQSAYNKINCTFFSKQKICYKQSEEVSKNDSDSQKVKWFDVGTNSFLTKIINKNKLTYNHFSCPVYSFLPNGVNKMMLDYKIAKYSNLDQSTYFAKVYLYNKIDGEIASRVLTQYSTSALNQYNEGFLNVNPLSGDQVINLRLDGIDPVKNNSAPINDVIRFYTGSLRKYISNYDSVDQKINELDKKYEEQNTSFENVVQEKAIQNIIDDFSETLEKLKLTDKRESRDAKEIERREKNKIIVLKDKFIEEKDKFEDDFVRNEILSFFEEASKWSVQQPSNDQKIELIESTFANFGVDFEDMLDIEKYNVRAIMSESFFTDYLGNDRKRIKNLELKLKNIRRKISNAEKSIVKAQEAIKVVEQASGIDQEDLKNKKEKLSNLNKLFNEFVGKEIGEDLQVEITALSISEADLPSKVDNSNAFDRLEAINIYINSEFVSQIRALIGETDIVPYEDLEVLNAELASLQKQEASLVEEKENLEVRAAVISDVNKELTIKEKLDLIAKEKLAKETAYRYFAEVSNNWYSSISRLNKELNTNSETKKGPVELNDIHANKDVDPNDVELVPAYWVDAKNCKRDYFKDLEVENPIDLDSE